MLRIVQSKMNKLTLLFGFLLTVHNQSTAKPIFKNGVNGIFGNKFQGDIKLNKAQEIYLSDNPKNQSSKTGWTWEGFRWTTDSHGLVIVPYRIDSSEGFCKNNFCFGFSNVEYYYFQYKRKSR